jgi:hypothetical protein
MIISFPKEEVLKLKKTYHLRQFVETGTFQGDAAAWAATRFDKVITIEIHPGYYDAAIARFDRINVVPYLGNSPVVLKEKRDEIMQLPTFFFLDAHWSGGLHYEKIPDECPLMEELKIINGMNFKHVVMVDDALMFYGNLPDCNTPEKWPGVAEVRKALENNGQREVYQIGDNFFAIPK